MQVQSISQLTRLIKSQLNQRFPAVWVAGEISGITQPSSGHIYFTLKDSHAQINAIIWRTDAEQLNFQLASGLKVICRGGVDVYPQRGSYQLIVRKIQPQGIGGLELALRQLRSKLSAEGLFDPQHKRSLPQIPKHIAVVTSPSGAAVRDFLQVLLRRWPTVRVTIVPVRVQGSGSSSEVVAGIQACHQFAQPPDVIVVTRGGGSIEDLWTFNEESVVRAIFASSIPTVTAIGHEIDVTLSDLVADVRALTPSEAAERLVPELAEVKSLLHDVQSRLRNAVTQRFEQARRDLQQFANRPVITRPLDQLQQQTMEIDFLEQSLHHQLARVLEKREAMLTNIAGRLEALSPLSVLSRGFSLTMNDNHELIVDCQKVSVGDRIRTRVRNGTLLGRVEQVEPNDAD